MRNFIVDVFPRIVSHNLLWQTLHGQLTDDELTYLCGAALTDLFAATNGSPSLVTEELIFSVYQDIRRASQSKVSR